MRRIRVLIVHTQAIARRRASLSMAGDPLFVVVGTAPNGRIGAVKAAHSHPDVVIADPELDPESTQQLQDLRRTQRGILFFSYPKVAEPSAPSDSGELLVQSRLRDELVPKIVAAVPWVREGSFRPRAGGAPRVDVVAIGVSTGGPNALAALVPKLPADFPVPVVVVQHMPPLFTRLLAERLTNIGPMTFVEGAAGMKLEPGKGYIAPGDFHMTVAREGDEVLLALNQDQPENSCRPAVDVLFRSVAETYGPHALAVVLTGMGSDGLRGMEVLRAGGVRNVVQDEKTSVVWGMPGAVAKAGLADQILALDDIPLAIVRSVREGRAWTPAGLASLLVADAEARQSPRVPATAPLSPPTTSVERASTWAASTWAASPSSSPSPTASTSPATPASVALPPFRPVTAPVAVSTPAPATSAPFVAAITAEDFAFVSKFIYDESAIVLEVGKEYLVESRLITLARRIGMKEIAELVAKLRRGNDAAFDRKVIEAMTTNETSFFRDVDPFEALRKTVLPDLVRQRSAERKLRIWCGASSSGQEPFSIAMLLRDTFPNLDGWNIDIVSSDISVEMLERCRSGRYSQLEVGRGLPAPLLVKYFERDGAHWRLKPVILDMVRFFELNLAGPWPLMESFDLVFMRNVLIYFDTQTKKDILGKVRRLLRPDGYMFLGGAETTFNLDDGFVREMTERVSYYRLVR